MADDKRFTFFAIGGGPGSGRAYFCAHCRTSARRTGRNAARQQPIRRGGDGGDYQGRGYFQHIAERQRTA